MPPDFILLRELIKFIHLLVIKIKRILLVTNKKNICANSLVVLSRSMRASIRKPVSLQLTQTLTNTLTDKVELASPRADGIIQFETKCH